MTKPAPISIEAFARLRVRDVSLEAGAGEFLALLGPSGSGKGTLLMALAGLAFQNGVRSASPARASSIAPPTSATSESPSKDMRSLSASECIRNLPIPLL
ncbi:ATP-binding cassette domain-containing protein [Mesorhizobium sp. PL10]